MTGNQMEQDEQKFHKKLIDDQTGLEDKLDTLQMIVAGFSSKTDIRKSAEMANEVKERDEGSRKDCQNQGVLFNQRERLFGVQVIPYDKIGKLTRDFEQLNNLWITAADWLKWYKTWMNDSLINIDPELLANNVNNAFKTMHKSVKHFGELPKCLDVEQQVKQQIEDVCLYNIPLIQGLRNPCRHEKQALDKMEPEWEPMLMEISPYKETGTFIMKSSEEMAGTDVGKAQV